MGATHLATDRQHWRSIRSCTAHGYHSVPRHRLGGAKELPRSIARLLQGSRAGVDVVIDELQALYLETVIIMTDLCRPVL